MSGSSATRGLERIASPAVVREEQVGGAEAEGGEGARGIGPPRPLQDRDRRILLAGPRQGDPVGHEHVEVRALGLRVRREDGRRLLRPADLVEEASELDRGLDAPRIGSEGLAARPHRAREVSRPAPEEREVPQAQGNARVVPHELPRRATAPRRRLPRRTAR